MERLLEFRVSWEISSENPNHWARYVYLAVMCHKSFESCILSIEGVSDKGPEERFFTREQSRIDRCKSIEKGSLRFLANCL